MKREKFILNSVKVNKKEGLDIVYSEFTNEEDGEHEVPFTCEHPGRRHPDFDKALKKLVPFLAKTYHVTDATEKLLSEIKQEITPGNEKIVSRLKEIQKDLLSKVTVTGISISGEEQFRGVIISGKIEGFNSNSAMNTTRVVFAQDSLGFEKEVEEIVDVIEEEVFQYLTKNKRAQLELEFSNTETPSENGNGHSKKENAAQSKKGKKKVEQEVEA
jgi:hypothetical protein